MISGAKPGYLAEVRDCGSGDVEANAHLISAAPDLLEAAELCALIAEAHGLDLIAEKAKAAAKKARGQ